MKTIALVVNLSIFILSSFDIPAAGAGTIEVYSVRVERRYNRIGIVAVHAPTRCYGALFFFFNFSRHSRNTVLSLHSYFIPETGLNELSFFLVAKNAFNPCSK
jgi:hypothetical protein